MSETEAKILEKLAAIEAEIAAMREEFSISRVTYFENLSPFAIVGVDYVAFRFNCSAAAVVRGRFGTDAIPRIRKKPIAFRKADVDTIWQKMNVSVEEKAAEIRYKTKTRRNKC